MRGKKNIGRAVRVEGHADASGTPEANMALSQKRADAVKQDMIDKGTDPGLLEAVGMGAAAPKVAGDPFAAANRRVEIGRQTATP
jgi:outer membrane protein OmpA-like peptidoglycan-associated protein